jgi:glycosyl transferase family 25
MTKKYLLPVIIFGTIFICLYTNILPLNIHFVGTKKLSENDIKIFVINLDRTPKRYESIATQLNNYGLSHERFSAVDGYLLDITDENGKVIKGYDLKNQVYSIEQNKHYLIGCPSENITYYSSSKPYCFSGEFGCSCSHREIWLKMIRDNIPYALILEDDAVLAGDFRAKYLTTIAHFPEDADLVYLFVAHKNKRFEPLYMNKYYKRIPTAEGMLIGTAGSYIISLRGAKILLDDSKNFSDAIDILMEKSITMKKIISYITSPLLTFCPIGIDPKDSIIHQMGRANY